MSDPAVFEEVPFGDLEDTSTGGVATATARAKQGALVGALTGHGEMAAKYVSGKFHPLLAQDRAQIRSTFLKTVAGRGGIGRTSLVRQPGDVNDPQTPSRIDRILATLLRQESLVLVEELSKASSPEDAHARVLDFLLSSNQNLQTIASLVSEDLVGVTDHRLHLTEFGERVIEKIAAASTKE